MVDLLYSRIYVLFYLGLIIRIEEMGGLVKVICILDLSIFSSLSHQSAYIIYWILFQLKSSYVHHSFSTEHQEVLGSPWYPTSRILIVKGKLPFRMQKQIMICQFRPISYDSLIGLKPQVNQSRQYSQIWGDSLHFFNQWISQFIFNFLYPTWMPFLELNFSLEFKSGLSLFSSGV